MLFRFDIYLMIMYLFFFFKQKTAYEMRISDWSSDVCSSDLPGTNEEISSFCSTNYGVDFPMFSKLVATGEGRHPLYSALIEAQPKATPADEDMREKLKGYGITPTPEPEEIGRASCRERVCQYV